MSVLVLNADGTPINVVSDQRAVVMVHEDIVFVIAKSDKVFRSPSTTIEVPSVVMVTRYIPKPYRPLANLTRKNLLARDNYECCYCEARRGTTVDHVIPRAKGGKHEWDNVVAACEPCNNKKSDTLLKDLGWKMRFSPYRPTPLDEVRWGRGWTNPDWLPYLPETQRPKVKA
jgi:5-methylcytosine-specific restriction endonuclease McrA